MSRVCAKPASRLSPVCARASARSTSSRAGAIGDGTLTERSAAVADPVVLYEVDDKINVITLNRSDKLNAISPELMHQLLDAFARADAEPATSVVLLRAEGRSFCAGYDIGRRPEP